MLLTNEVTCFLKMLIQVIHYFSIVSSSNMHKFSYVPFMAEAVSIFKQISNSYNMEQLGINTARALCKSKQILNYHEIKWSV